MGRSAESLIGAVLCGGESRRMGRDKGLIQRNGICWAAWMGRKLLPWELPVAFSIRAEQEQRYSAVMPAACFVTDTMDGAGPLNGLLSVHRQFPERDILLLGCDMLDLDEATIGELISVYRAETGAGCYHYRDNEQVQPLCAIYTASGFKQAGDEVGPVRSLRGLIQRMQVNSLEIKRAEAFRNYNSPDGAG
ncbi:MAG TPA: molybdenum cofactor guanylyltransferase [Puia sp.]|nr:molybdenum cofactor guanylyltransferase [Puia sp.]